MLVPVTSGSPEPTVKSMDESTQTETSEEKLESQTESKQNDRNRREGKQEGREATEGGGGQETQAHTGKKVVTTMVMKLLSFLHWSWFYWTPPHYRFNLSELNLIMFTVGSSSLSGTWYLLYRTCELHLLCESLSLTYLYFQTTPVAAVMTWIKKIRIVSTTRRAPPLTPTTGHTADHAPTGNYPADLNLSSHIQLHHIPGAHRALLLLLHC